MLIQICTSVFVHHLLVSSLFYHFIYRNYRRVETFFERYTRPACLLKYIVTPTDYSLSTSRNLLLSLSLFPLLPGSFTSSILPLHVNNPSFVSRISEVFVFNPGQRKFQKSSTISPFSSQCCCFQTAAKGQTASATLLSQNKTSLFSIHSIVSFCSSPLFHTLFSAQGLRGS